MNTQEKIDHIVNWLKSYSENSGTKGFVVGVSGGVDSAVVSTLCAMTGFPTTLVSMPIRQNKDELDRAFLHMSWLTRKHVGNVDWHIMDLTEPFNNFSSMLPDEMKSNLNMANLRSRLRMCNLYVVAGASSKVVVGTGNKVEDFGVGFYTKYGDGGVDISPIADLMKTEVWEIARHIGISSDIVDAKPTDGLWDDGRGDEDQLGATYPELEKAMKQKEKFNNLNDIEDVSPREIEVLSILNARNKANRHKMDPIPVCKMPYNS